MPRAKNHKEKTLKDLRQLLDRAGVNDRVIAEYIAGALKSDNAMERTKGAEMAREMRGFNNVDTRGEHLEQLPLANVSLDELSRLTNRCSACKHKQFEPIRAVWVPVAAPVSAAGGPAIPASPTDAPVDIVSPVESVRPIEPVPGMVKPDDIPGMPGLPGIETHELQNNEQTTQEKAD